MRIERVLIANRGEVVERIVRTCRRMGIATVAVYSDADHDARFVELADAAVRLGGLMAADSYLAQERVIAAALRSGADAIHPGYGFLAENSEFARRCGDAGLIFIGPEADTIATMGDKVAAKGVVSAAGVRLLPTVELEPGQVGAPEVQSLGFPVIVKATAGGGGKGMHVVNDPDGLGAAVQRAQRESVSAFGDGRVFLEPYLTSVRHIEVQVFGDTHGTIAVLHERECSLQRRHQKVVEEAPSPAVSPELRLDLGDAAARVAQAVSYTGAGTVEFLLTQDGAFYFLEMNTRLQVEHAVTEQVTGLDLVELQIRIAQGEPLPPEACDPPMRGSAIEVRLYAEDPSKAFAPSAGELERFELATNGLRVESGVRTGDVVTPYYDPMLAKLIAHAPTREEGALRLASRLAESQIYGIETNRDLLVRLLRSPRFLENNLDTGFLDGPAAEELAVPLAVPQLEAEHAIAAALAGQAARRAAAPELAGLPSGWRNNRSIPQRERFEGRAGPWTVSYAITRDGVHAEAAGRDLTVAAEEVPHCDPRRVDLVIDGVRHRFSIHRRPGRAWVTGHGAASAFELVPRYPASEREYRGTLSAPMPGVVLSVHVTVGEQVAQGDVLATLEAMKMEIEIVAPEDGLVAELSVTVGELVEAGRLLAVIEPASG